MTTQRKLIQDTFISKEEHKINIQTTQEIKKKNREETQQKNVHKVRTGNSQKEKAKWLR